MKDRWGRTIEYVRLSLTDACNFRCPYCRPEEITPDHVTNLLTPIEWMKILEAFHLLGVKALRLTGGEPLLYPGIEELLGRVKQSQWFSDISMTTNASLLALKAKELKELGLDRVNISLDSVEEKAFAIAVGKDNQLPAVLEGIQSAIDGEFKSVKINTVLSRYWSDEEVGQFLAYIKQWTVIWRCIEYMPFQGDSFKGPNFDEWRTQIERVIKGKLVPATAVPGYGPATYVTLPNGQVMGFIFAMSHNYCDTCNRVRLTSDGRLRLCLLRDDEMSLVDYVRNGASIEQLAEYIVDVLQLRHDKHDNCIKKTLQRPMWRIGG